MENVIICAEVSLAVGVTYFGRRRYRDLETSVCRCVDHSCDVATRDRHRA
jgi:hypothetical protein